MKLRFVFYCTTLVLLAMICPACSSDSKNEQCQPEAYFCEGTTVRKCTSDGTNSVLVQVCEEQCSAGECVSIAEFDAQSEVSACPSGEQYCLDGMLLFCSSEGSDTSPMIECPGGCNAEGTDCEPVADVLTDVAEDLVDPVDGDCNDECAEGDFQCTGIKVLHQCILGENGCWAFDEGVPCDDEDPCTDDACAVDKGCVTADNTEPCDAGDPCTGDDKCGDGECLPGEFVCECQEDDDCEPPEDFDPCNGAMVCDENSCKVDPSQVIDCGAPPDDCHIVGCDEGGCFLDEAADGTPCDDGNICTENDQCTAGVCAGEDESACEDVSVCTIDSCDPTVGCVYENVANGLPCEDDGDACTVDSCQDGECTHSAVADGTPCDDGDICTDPDTCSAGQCSGVEDYACEDGNPCTKDLCDPIIGCTWEDEADGMSCGQFKVCEDGTCVDGCVNGEKRRCWVECSQDYPADCLGGNSALIMGIETCGNGAWGNCVTKMQCDVLSAQCPNGNGTPTSYQCLDGTNKTGTMTCFKPLGVNCSANFYSGWGPGDCPDLCLGEGDACNVPEQSRPCETHCDTPSGPIQAGTQVCQGLCDNDYVWGPCMTEQACN